MNKLKVNITFPLYNWDGIYGEELCDKNNIETEKAMDFSNRLITQVSSEDVFAPPKGPTSIRAKLFDEQENCIDTIDIYCEYTENGLSKQMEGVTYSIQIGDKIYPTNLSNETKNKFNIGGQI